MNEQARSLAKVIRAMMFDVDGVLTDNRVPLGKGGGENRMRSYYDGQGTSLLRAIGFHLCFITNEKGDSAAGLMEFIEKLNNLPSSKSEANANGWHPIKLYTGMGGVKKGTAAEEFLGEIGIPFEQAGFMGDDLVDIHLFKRVAFRAAPASAEKVVREMCHFVSERPGGYGAMRDVANFILEVRGIDPTSIPPG